MTGFIALDRGALDHPLLKDAERFRAWFWLIANAAWKPTRTRIKGDVVEIDRGELSYSVRFLGDRWGWSKSRVDRFLSDLRAEGMIETRSKIGTTAGRSAGQGQSIITICNYNKYQSSPEDVRDNDKPRSGTTAGQQRDKEEQGNKETRDIPSPNGDGRAAPEPLALDLAAAIFRTGLNFLLDSGHKEPAARSIIGRWRKTYTDGAVLAVLARCQNTQPAPSSPIEWITKALQVEQQRAAGQAPQPQNPSEERASVREIGMDLAARKRRERVEQQERIAIGAR